MVYAWYPASHSDGTPAAYMPGADRLRLIAASTGLTNSFGPVWAQIESNDLRSHSFDNASVIPNLRLPVLVFSPGGGTTPVAYTSQMEELASYGYLVVGVAHTYDAPAVVFPDGRVVTASNEYWAGLHREIPDNEAFERRISDMFAEDIHLVIDKLTELNTDRSSLLYGKIDNTRIGVFGHSRGGRTAARVCQLDSRVAACLSEDGSFSWQPFWPDASGASMRQPFMMLDHLDPELPDEIYAQIGTTREAYTSERAAKQDRARETIYKTITAGSYQVTIATPGVSHNSFSDVRLLGRPDAAAINLWPKDVQAKTPHAKILSLVTAYARAFFDKYVRQIPAPLLEGSPAMQDVAIRRYGAAAK
jgi:dienelactone hydrolase